MQVQIEQGNLFNVNEADLSLSDFSRNQWIHNTLSILVERMNAPTLIESDVIKWSCPVPAFGDLSRSSIATLGLNPSNKEFVDDFGNELDGLNRRFHTLRSLGLECWSETEDEHLDLISYSCQAYFSRNPYDTWFKKLDYLISGTQVSFYDSYNTACHLDLIPYATSCKWIELNKLQRSSLLMAVADTLGILLKESPIKILILNGKSVVSHFQSVSGIELEQEIKSEWELPRKTQSGVKGIAYKGFVNSISGIDLGREILVLGYNHNIQSSFGVTKQVTNAIKNWITASVKKEFYEE